MYHHISRAMHVTFVLCCLVGDSSEVLLETEPQVRRYCCDAAADAIQLVASVSPVYMCCFPTRRLCKLLQRHGYSCPSWTTYDDVS